MKELTSHLVNIHSQYNTLELKSKEYQLDIVDTLANLNVTRNEFSKKYKILIDKRNKLELLKQHLSKSLQQSDYNKFQLEELEILNLDQTNFEQIEIDLKKLKIVKALYLLLILLQKLLVETIKLRTKYVHFFLIWIELKTLMRT